jgi:hypothetical protein
MNKEQLGLLNDTYKRYYDEMIKTTYNDNGVGITRPYTQEEFINKCNTDDKFSEKWRLKIEERELSLEERHKIALPIWKEQYGPLADMMVPTNVDNTPFKIPTKLITVTYKDKTMESYE